MDKYSFRVVADSGENPLGKNDRVCDVILCEYSENLMKSKYDAFISKIVTGRDITFYISNSTALKRYGENGIKFCKDRIESILDREIAEYLKYINKSYFVTEIISENGELIGYAENGGKISKFKNTAESDEKKAEKNGIEVSKKMNNRNINFEEEFSKAEDDMEFIIKMEKIVFSVDELWSESDYKMISNFRCMLTKKYMIDRLRDIVSKIENDDFNTIAPMLGYSGSGDGYGSENYFIEFGRGKSMDIVQAICELLSYKTNSRHYFNDATGKFCESKF